MKKCSKSARNNKELAVALLQSLAIKELERFIRTKARKEKEPFTKAYKNYY